MKTYEAFKPMNLAGMALQSHIVRSATAERIPLDSDEEAERLGKKYAELARGGVGMVVTGHVAVAPSGHTNRTMPGAYSETQAARWALVARTAHAGGAVVCGQINHTGGRSKGELGPQYCVSVIPERTRDAMVGQELTSGEIEDLIEAFAAAARLMRDAGMDAVQIHAAHGYLINQFLSPLTNRRSDAWGGELEGRARFGRRVVLAVRRAVGPGFPVGMKFGVFDDDPAGLSVEESLGVAKWFEEDGLDFIEISGGFRMDVIARNVRAGKGEGYYASISRQFKEVLGIPVISVGGYRTLEAIDKALKSGVCDAVALSRPLIRQPNVAEALKKDGAFTCLGCNLCLLNMEGETRCHRR